MMKAMKDEAWDLICQVKKDIFTEFLKIRMVGNPAVNMAPGPHRTATVIYALLRGQQFMASLVAAQFARHPCLSPSLNNFCLSKRASAAEVLRVEAKANQNTKLIDLLKSEVHKKRDK
jgi:hypothetical protein